MVSGERESQKNQQLVYVINTTKPLPSVSSSLSFFLSFFSFFFFFFLCFTHSLWEIKGKRARKKVSKIERQEKVRKFKSTVDAGYRLSVLCVCVCEWDFLIHWERFFLLLLWTMVLPSCCVLGFVRMYFFFPTFSMLIFF